MPPSRRPPAVPAFRPPSPPALLLLSLFLLLPALAPGAARAQSLADIAKQAQTAHLGIFNKTEVKAGPIGPLPKWLGVLEKMKAQKEMLKRCAAQLPSCDPADAKPWREVEAEAASLEPMARLKAVNAFFNKWPYKTDLDNYGVDDYWATPVEFMTRSGDCEDYAIAKFYALLQLGVPNDDMRIVAIMDHIRNIGHAVLVVRIGNDSVVLDNLSNLVMSHTRYPQYDPQFSVNETTRWMHIGTIATK